MKYAILAPLFALLIISCTCNKDMGKTNDTATGKPKFREVWMDLYDTTLTQKIDLEKDVFYCVYKTGNILTLVSNDVFYNTVYDIKNNRISKEDQDIIDNEVKKASNSRLKIANVSNFRYDLIGLIEFYKNPNLYALFDESKGEFITKVNIYDEGYNKGPLRFKRKFILKVNGINYYTADIMS